jgi:aspartate carbamoyltransferase catalytic subunit
VISGRVWRSIDDFSDADVEWVMARAELHRTGLAPPLVSQPLVGLCFLEASLRTRLGFAAAAGRIGGRHIDVVRRRESEISRPESIHDTLRTVMGYCDVVVARLGEPLAGPNLPSERPAPLVNGGDRGPDGEHPTQALLDLFALSHDLGDLAGRTVAICGDPRMRAVTSLLRLLPRFGVELIVLLTLPELERGWRRPAGADGIVRRASWSDLPRETAVLYMAGVPHGAVSLEDRGALTLTADRLAALPRELVVTSPLPVIDEISPEARADPRVRAFHHSDLGLFTRMAVLELALLGGPTGG